MATGNFNFKLTFMMKNLTVYTKRSPSYNDFWDKSHNLQRIETGKSEFGINEYTTLALVTPFPMFRRGKQNKHRVIKLARRSRRQKQLTT